MKLSELDLNHVRALHALLEEAHVARAARRLGITAAAASNALHRLRDEFDDPLLVRVGREFARTSLAEKLLSPAKDVMAAAERLLSTVTPFDPARFDGTFILSAADRTAEALLGPLDDILRKNAPLAVLRLRTTIDSTRGLRSATGESTQGRLAANAQGLYVAPANALDMCSEPLFSDEYVCVLRKGNPLATGALTAKRFARADHVLVAPRDASDRGVVDDALAELGLTRRVSRVVTSFALALPFVAASDRIVTLPRTFADARPMGVAEGALVQRKPPIRLPPIEMHLGWPPQLDRDPAYVWFRGAVHQAVRRAKVHARLRL